MLRYHAKSYFKNWIFFCNPKLIPRLGVLKVFITIWTSKGFTASVFISMFLPVGKDGELNGAAIALEVFYILLVVVAEFGRFKEAHARFGHATGIQSFRVFYTSDSSLRHFMFFCAVVAQRLFTRHALGAAFTFIHPLVNVVLSLRFN